MKVLELFSGTRSVGRAFEAEGHQVLSVDWDETFEGTDWVADVYDVGWRDVLEKLGTPDVVWASPDCSTYSVAAISHHRAPEENGNLAPQTEYAKECDRVNMHVHNLLMMLTPKLWFIENPRGGMRKMDFMHGLERHTVTYCQYGDSRMKPTDIWTNHPNPRFRPACRNGDPCHVSAPRGSKAGTQGIKGSVDRGRIPAELCEHVVRISEEYVTRSKGVDMAHEAWFKRLREACERLRASCRRECDGIGYCQRCFDEANRVTRRRK